MQVAELRGGEERYFSVYKYERRTDSAPAQAPEPWVVATRDPDHAREGTGIDPDRSPNRSIYFRMQPNELIHL